MEIATNKFMWYHVVSQGDIWYDHVDDALKMANVHSEKITPIRHNQPPRDQCLSISFLSGRRVADCRRVESNSGLHFQVPAF